MVVRSTQCTTNINASKGNVRSKGKGKGGDGKSGKSNWRAPCEGRLPSLDQLRMVMPMEPTDSLADLLESP